MRRLTFYIFALFLLATSCGEVDNKTLTSTEVATVSAPEQTVKDFFSWYVKNVSRLNEINLLKEIPEGDTLSFYSVDFDATKQYLTELKKSGFVSDEYLSMFVAGYQSADSTFKQTHQNEGPPEGFDIDWVLQTQDDYNIVHYLDKAFFENTQQTNDKCATTIIFPSEEYQVKYDARLTKHGDKWLIDDLVPLY